MALRKTMPLSDLKRPEGNEVFATEYRASRGGYFPAEDKPVPGQPKTDDKKKRN
ncbi:MULTISPECIES: hypothetical protein [unclassified Streptomyces]|uniref:hypothetical protein n=1 Tax=unclassified Streptomyces TaxID=2593676 RepID=UPI00017F13FC|nr:hypothetical protein [Streptomyces sp. SPB074]EDY44015.1 hypothetical protein SSBG_02205 [Streptomyces sp. SPB074]